MADNTLTMAMEGMRSIWGPLTTELAASARRHMEDLLRALATEEWLAELRREGPASKELYRDPDHSFVLLAHTEQTGQYRAPHDHGRGWVIYGVQEGEMEMGTYARVQDSEGRVGLVRRESYRHRAGETRVYLPGDIHDTRCTAGPALYYRFTDRDLKKEENEGHRITRFVEQDGVWRAGATCGQR